MSSSSAVSTGPPRLLRSFGEEPIEVLVKGDLQQLVLSSDIQRLVGARGVPVGQRPGERAVQRGRPQRAVRTAGACAHGEGGVRSGHVHQRGGKSDQRTAHRADQTGRSPGQAGRRSVVHKAALARGLGAAEAGTLAPPGEQGHPGTLSGVPGQARAPVRTDRTPERGTTPTSSRRSCSTPAKPAGTPKARFAYLFPSPNAALVSVRLKAGLSESARTHTIGLIRQAVAMPQWRLQHGESYLLTGEPVIVSDLNSSITHSIELLLVAVLLVMAGTLGADLLRAPAAVAARYRPARRRAHIRRAVARGRVADDGLDRRAAGAGGARGGLRDPVPVARGGGPRAGSERRAGWRRRARGRARRSRRSRRPRPPAPRRYSC